MSLAIRAVRQGEAGLVREFILKLADYEKKRDEVTATVEDVDAALFAEYPKLFCDIAEWNNAPCGFALWFYNFSSFHGRHGIYLEDLFVEPAYRGRGIGKALLRHLAQRCKREELTRLQWWVLDWNSPSIAFYKSLGAKPMEEWTVFRVSGDELAKLAQS
jgi:GNAT superfamily N-acetyltransferase